MPDSRSRKREKSPRWRKQLRYQWSLWLLRYLWLIALLAVVLGYGGYYLFTGWRARDLAGKAQERNITMSDTRDSLVPVEAQIRKLLNTEEELTRVAESYTKVEEDHAFWFDLIGELNGAFASDSVWLTEMTPLYDYNPLAPETVGSSKPTARPVVKSDFASAQGNASSVSEPASPAPLAGRPNNRPNQPQVVPAAAANAILIKGYWRNNNQTQNIVSNRLKRLREKSTSFRFSAKAPNGKEIPLSDEQIILKLANSADTEGDLAFPFEITLPLARPVAVR
jgi:hypothetical protein